MTNILSISLGSFKLDVPLDSLTKAATLTSAPQKVSPAIVKEVEAPKEALPPKVALPVITRRPPPPSISGRTDNHSFTLLVRETIRNMSPGDSAFLPHPSKRTAQTRALNTATQLREGGFFCVISTRQTVENGVTGARIWRLR